MTTELDLRGVDPADARATIVDRVSDCDPGDAFTVVADHDPETGLYLAEIAHGVELTWSHEDDGDERWAVRVRLTDGDRTSPVAFDVRPLPPNRRHTVLRSAFESLTPETSFLLINDHDPKPLYHELRSTYGDVVEWEYRNRGGSDWRVEIGKAGPTETEAGDVAASFDVREIPKPDRHPTIHHRYGNLEPGDRMEIVTPHEPRPLRREFHQRYGDAFEWEVRENEPGRCRVRITKGDRSSGTDSARGAERAAEEGTAELTVTEELDVREYPPAKRHELIFERYAALQPGEGFVLVNDHDPKPLYHQFEAETGPEFRWEYRRRDPGEFRVLVGMAEGTGDERAASTGVDAPF